MGLVAKLLVLAAVVAAAVAALLALASGDSLVVIALVVIGILAIGAVSLTLFVDLFVTAAKQVLGRPRGGGEI